VRVKGIFGFDNGFGDKFEGLPICFFYLGSFNVKSVEGAPTSGGNGFYRCDEFEELVPYLVAHPWK
jgi:hypothetical protein